MYNLIVYANDDMVIDMDIEKVEAIIGKASDADIALKGWNVSKLHARLVINDEDIFVEDCGSMFGTYVNNERIVRHGPLTSSDVIRIGSYAISVIAIADPDKVDRAAAFGATPVRQRDGAAGDVAVVEPARVIAPPRPAPSGQAVIATARPERALRQDLHPVSQSALPARTADDLVFAKWRRLVHEAVLSEMDLRRIDVNRLKDDELRANVRLIIREVIQASRDLPVEIDLNELAVQVLDEAVGLGPLEPLLADDEVSEIMVNKFDEIWVEKRGQLSLSNATFTSDAAVLGAIERIVTPLGRRIDESSPMVDARLKDGSRVNAIIPPLAIRGPSLTIRKFSKRQITAADFVSFGSLTEEMVELIQTIVRLRLNVIISGGTGTGKTTFLNMVGSYVANDERIVTIEDAAELKLTQPNLVSLESRPPNLEGKGVIAIRDLVRNSLRMRPDRIIVGECRGGEALDMLQAMNTGHDGSMTTLHSNSPRDAMARLEVLVLMAGMNLPVRAIREQIASAVHIVVQLTRFSCGARKVTSISEIVGMEGEIIQMQEVYRFRRTGRDADERTVGVFEYSGLKPDFLKRLDA
jgi:pilus assembly protein CpaF